MFSNRFSGKFKSILAVLILAPLCAYASGVRTVSFHRKVLDRISVLYLMGNDMEKSIVVQRKAMKPQYQTDISADTRKDVDELIKLLKEIKANKEAENWQNEFASLSGETESAITGKDAVPEIVEKAVESETPGDQENEKVTPVETQEPVISDETKVVKIERSAGTPFSRQLPDSFRLRVRTDDYTEAPPISSDEPEKQVEEKTEPAPEASEVESQAPLESEKEKPQEIEPDKSLEPAITPEDTASSDSGKSTLKQLLKDRLVRAKLRNEELKADRLALREAEKQAAEQKTESESKPKTEPKAEAKAEPKAEPKTEPVAEIKAEPKTKPIAETKIVQPASKQQVVKKSAEPAVTEFQIAREVEKTEKVKASPKIEPEVKPELEYKAPPSVQEAPERPRLIQNPTELAAAEARLAQRISRIEELRAEPIAESTATKQPEETEAAVKTSDSAVAEARPLTKRPKKAKPQTKQRETSQPERQVAQKKAKAEKLAAKTQEEEWMPDYKLHKEKRSATQAPKKDGTEEYRHSKPLFPDAADGAVSAPQPGKSVIISSSPDVNQLKALSDTKVSLNFRDADLADIVRMLASKGNLNIVSRNPIKGKTTVNFDNIHVGMAIDIILRTNDYLYEIKDGVLWIFSRGEEPVETKVFFVRNAVAANILPMIQQALGQTPDLLQRETGSSDSAASTGVSTDNTTSSDTTGGNSMMGTGAAAQGSNMGGMSDSSSGSSSSTANSYRGNVYLDERSNSLIVTAPHSKLNEISKLIEVYDSRSSTLLEERVFKLMHIDKKTLEDAIKMVVPSFDPAKQMFEVQRSSQGTSGGKGKL
ncbi:MAG: hypothetical protein KKB51_19640 [Candidatus Riflebacteria bacterium]|nr:hypothetical protein [Candidatus Riflebacteria bacterium]